MSSSSAQDVVMEEEVDPNYEPNDHEIAEYAKWLGMDLEADKELFWIAKEGLKVRCQLSWRLAWCPNCKRSLSRRHRFQSAGSPAAPQQGRSTTCES
jgi:hypothetical protein